MTDMPCKEVNLFILPSVNYQYVNTIEYSKLIYILNRRTAEWLASVEHNDIIYRYWLRPAE